MDNPGAEPFDARKIGLILLMKSLRSLTLLPVLEMLDLYARNAEREDRFSPVNEIFFLHREVDISPN